MQCHLVAATAAWASCSKGTCHPCLSLSPTTRSLYLSRVLMRPFVLILGTRDEKSQKMEIKNKSVASDASNSGIWFRIFVRYHKAEIDVERGRGGEGGREMRAVWACLLFARYLSSPSTPRQQEDGFLLIRGRNWLLSFQRSVWHTRCKRSAKESSAFPNCPTPDWAGKQHVHKHGACASVTLIHFILISFLLPLFSSLSCKEAQCKTITKKKEPLS